MDDQESGSSTGLVIGMIVGGVVVLALIVLVVLGGAIFWTFERGAPGGGPVAPAPVMVAEEAPPPEPPMPALQVEKPREHLIGVWESKSKDGGVAIMEFREDGTLHMTNKTQGKADLAQPAVRWEVRTEKDGLIKLKIDTVKGAPNDHVVRFFGNDRMEVETMDGRVYERRKKGP